MNVAFPGAGQHAAKRPLSADHRYLYSTQLNLNLSINSSSPIGNKRPANILLHGSKENRSPQKALDLVDFAIQLAST